MIKLQKETDNLKYNNAKIYQIGLFSLNNAATNLYLALMGYISYYGNSIAGFSVMLISCLLTGLNIFNGVTDPIIGFFLDKTRGRFGKFRPFMLLGNLIMALSVVFLFLTTHELPGAARIPYFIVVYAFFIIGYTIQTVAGKSGQTVLTNNPNQRPLSTYFDSVFLMAVYGGSALFVANYLVPKYGGFTNEALYKEYIFWVILLSGACTLLAMAGIRNKDRESVYIAKKIQRLRVRDYLDVLRHNHPIRLLILAACTNKFTAAVYSNTTVGVMLFGILMGDYGISGLIGVVVAIPTLVVVDLGIRAAQRMGQKRSLVLFTALGILFQIVMAVVLMQKSINTVNFQLQNINLITIAFVVVYILLNGCKSITNNMVVPMIADCSDYEEYRSGKFVPGLMGALFSFADKVFTAFGTAFVGLIMMLIGYNSRFPQIGDTLTPVLAWTTIFLYCGIPILGWITSLLILRYYSLDNSKMKEIAIALQEE